MRVLRAGTNGQCGFGGGFLLGAMPRSAMMALFASRHRLRWRLYPGARETLEVVLRSLTAFRLVSTECSEALSRCEDKWKPGREVNAPTSPPRWSCTRRLGRADGKPPKTSPVAWGQASTQAVSFVPMQGSAITKAIGHLRRSEPTVRPRGEAVQAGGMRVRAVTLGPIAASPSKRIICHDAKGVGQ